MPNKVLFVLIDGLGDISGPIGGLTPLQLAHTPTFDRLASTGHVGLMDPVEAGVACGSDTAHLSILGYDPHRYYPGRGAFETMGTGLEVRPGDIAFKCVFSTLDPGSRTVLCRRADRQFESLGPALCEALNGLTVEMEGQEYTALIKYATEHRCGVCIRGPGLSPAITGTDPLKDRLPLSSCRPLNESKDAALSCKVVEAVSSAFERILAEHPINLERQATGKPMANIVLFRGPSGLPRFPTFRQLHGLSAFMIAPTCLIAGIGMALGIDVITVPGATGDHRSDFDVKFRRASGLLTGAEYDFGFVHIKAADEASHSGEPEAKVEILERIDRALGNFLRSYHKDDLVVVVTGDHTTPSFEYKDHSQHPVPFVIATAGNKLDSRGQISKFDEIAVTQGKLGRFTGSSVMPLIRHFLSQQ